MSDDFNSQLSDHIKALRIHKGWSLDELAQVSGVSRASLSRIEKGDVSPTTDVLSKLCTAHEIKMSKLLAMTESSFEPLIKRDDQMEWTDPKLGFTRRAVSPSTNQLQGEVLEVMLEPNTTIKYDKPSVRGLEHHIIVLDGQLTLTVEEKDYPINSGDCLRYFLQSHVTYKTGRSHAHYFVFLLGG